MAPRFAVGREPRVAVAAVTRPDLSGGLAARREGIRGEEPDVEFWSENMLFAIYDPSNDIGLWLHLGTVPNDWTMWHEMNYAYLPGDEGVLSMWSFHRTVPDRRPAGAGMEFRCLEPFLRWHVSFDGYGLHTSNEAMQAGLSPVGVNRRFVVNLEIESVTPAWDAHTATTAGTGRGACMIRVGPRSITSSCTGPGGQSTSAATTSASTGTAGVTTRRDRAAGRWCAVGRPRDYWDAVRQRPGMGAIAVLDAERGHLPRRRLGGRY